MSDDYYAQTTRMAVLQNLDLARDKVAGARHVLVGNPDLLKHWGPELPKAAIDLLAAATRVDELTARAIDRRELEKARIVIERLEGKV